MSSEESDAERDETGRLLPRKRAQKHGTESEPKFDVLPNVMGLQQWRQDTGDMVPSASGRCDDKALLWFRLAQNHHVTMSELAYCPRRFIALDRTCTRP